jgi:hypothetical protein
MITLYGDESHDDHTYALGGWLVTPTHYDILEAEWRTMLGTITMPDGSLCPAFHAALMTNQRGPFVGWTKDQALSAFNRATDVLAERPGRFAMWACAVAAEIPDGVSGKDKDAIWLILFMKFFALVLQTFPGAAGITFVFDTKDEITKNALDGYAKVSGALARDFPNVFLEEMSFVADEACAGVQAADLLLFEWRKRITDERLNPARVGSRPWFQRIREARPQGALVRFDVAKHINERHLPLDNAALARRMLFGDEVGRD